CRSGPAGGRPDARLHAEQHGRLPRAAKYVGFSFAPLFRTSASPPRGPTPPGVRRRLPGAGPRIVVAAPATRHRIAIQSIWGSSMAARHPQRTTLAIALFSAIVSTAAPAAAQEPAAGETSTPATLTVTAQKRDEALH